ncbi:MAG: type II toxin-antitoxin system RelB/DinJ family antitoxin [Coriobacteriales bacterium]|jgi:DNA-damage-inducible protein J|nr:type II toxin-antitoxin system RelB/DinJ family antitoxin [Coriobacteriales bacterium]
MEDARLSVRVNSELKQQAEQVFEQLGMTISTGINAFLKRVVAQKGIPFPLIVEQGSDLEELSKRIETEARKAVDKSISSHHASGMPVAHYDYDSNQPYLLYPNGTKETLIKSQLRKAP